MDLCPIFIHSLFRCGSTYLFEVFRTSPQGYRCYQEALHETVAQCRDDPSRLLGDLASQASELRHRDMELPHFYELYEDWPAWRYTVDEREVYCGYFRAEEDTGGIALWQSLMELDLGRPVFQECRTSGRMAQLKRQLGGYHIYLWRNPRDQWRSYGVQRYFGIVNRIILNAPGAPHLLGRLLEQMPSSRTQIANVQAAISQLYQTQLSEEQDYLLFYTLWCLGLIAGLRNADLLLSIDELSGNISYRREVLQKLHREGIGGLDFSGAAVPRQMHYCEEQLAIFARVEAEVHEAISTDQSLAPYLAQMLEVSFQYSP